PVPSSPRRRPGAPSNGPRPPAENPPIGGCSAPSEAASRDRSAKEDLPMTRMQLGIDDLMTEPISCLARARAAGPIVDFQLGGVAVVAREAVRALLADPRLEANFPEFLQSVGVSSGRFYDWICHSPLNRHGAD